MREKKEGGRGGGNVMLMFAISLRSDDVAADEEPGFAAELAAMDEFDEGMTRQPP